MRQYLDMLSTVLKSGVDRIDRTGVGTRSIFGYHMRFDLAAGFPLVTTKRLHWKSIVVELLWFLRGETHVAPLQAAGVRIWDEWSTAEQCARFGREPGDLGPIYGHQWRNYGATRRLAAGGSTDGIDQILRVVEEIGRDPSSRRLVVSAWNPKETDHVALPPCHTLFQFYVAERRLSCQVYQRSGDVFLGVPFNIASYALLTMMVAHVTCLEVGELVHTLGDAHLYKNHFAQACEQLARDPRPLPRVRLDANVRDLFSFRFPDHISLEGYGPHPAIKAEVAV